MLTKNLFQKADNVAKNKHSIQNNGYEIDIHGGCTFRYERGFEILLQISI
jgi:hypothetical protein